MRQLRRTHLGLLALALSMGLLAACANPTRVDGAGAARIATNYFASAHGSGTTVNNVKIESIVLGVDAGHSAWKVNISGDVIEAGSASRAYTSHEWLFVRADTGEVRVFAQGMTMHPSDHASEPHGTRTSLAPRLLLGVATGLLLGLLTSLSPFIAIVAILAVLVGTVVSVRRRADPSRTVQLAGTLVGAGAFLSYGAINTVAACINTDDFCGNANVWPLGALAVVTIGVGVVAAAVAVLRSPG